MRKHKKIENFLVGLVKFVLNKLRSILRIYEDSKIKSLLRLDKKKKNTKNKQGNKKITKRTDTVFSSSSVSFSVVIHRGGCPSLVIG